MLLFFDIGKIVTFMLKKKYILYITSKVKYRIELKMP